MQARILPARRGLTANALKLIAILAMTLDHIAWVFLPTLSPAGLLCHIAGRVTAPVMCYFVAEGYFHTSDVRRYIGRMLVFAALSHFPYVLCFGHGLFETTSVIWGLAMGLCALYLTDRKPLKSGNDLLAAACVLLAAFGDWSAMGPVWILLFARYRGDFKKQALAFSVSSLCLCAVFILQMGLSQLFQLALLLAVPLLALYNGARGKKTALSKWGFYVYYPAHLLALYGIGLYLAR